MYQQKLKITLTLILTTLTLSCIPNQPASPTHSPSLATNTLSPTGTPKPNAAPEFQGERAYQDIITQLNMGPRYPGSEGNSRMGTWLLNELRSSNWETEIQSIPQNDYTIQNVIAKRGEGEPWIIIGAHYDTRILADQDPDPQKQTLPVPGANDGASGVAVLLELARVLPDHLSGEIWLVFFDAEDNGNIPGWDWIMGSRAFVDSLEKNPDAVIIVDMVGDADLNIYLEKNSDQLLSQEIWRIAEGLGYTEIFIPIYKYRITDDHIPFIEAKIPAVDIIDFDYPYWHTTTDTLDKVSAESLQAVGDVVLAWILTKLSTESAP
jgi:Zn-dependent M28 family amino/carboxypeptidase